MVRREIRELSIPLLRGDATPAAGRACVLRIPSAVLPEEAHYLVNASHPEAAGFRLVSRRAFLFDERLIA